MNKLGFWPWPSAVYVAGKEKTGCLFLPACRPPIVLPRQPLFVSWTKCVKFIGYTWQNTFSIPRTLNVTRKKAFGDKCERLFEIFFKIHEILCKTTNLKSSFCIFAYKRRIWFFKFVSGKGKASSIAETSSWADNMAQSRLHRTAKPHILEPSSEPDHAPTNLEHVYFYRYALVAASPRSHHGVLVNQQVASLPHIDAAFPAVYYPSI